MLSKINKSAAFLSGIIIFGLMFYNVYATCARYFFNAPPKGALEISTYLIPVLVFIALAFTLEQGKHIMVDVLFSRLDKRKQLFLSILASILIALFSAILIWKGGKLSISKINEVSGSDLLLPLFPFYICLPIGGLLLLLQSIRDIKLSVLSLARKSHTSKQDEKCTS